MALAAAHTPTITYIVAYATLGTAIGTIMLAGATFYLALKTKATAAAANDELAESVAQSRAMATQTSAVVAQTKAVAAQADAMKAQSDAATAQVELLRKQAEATGRQSDAAEAALSASIRPLLAAVPAGTVLKIPPSMEEHFRYRNRPEKPAPTEVEASHLYCVVNEAGFAQLTIRVQNIGQGVAFVDRMALTYARDLGSAPVLTQAKRTAIGSGQLDSFFFTSRDDPDGRPDALRQLLESGERLLAEVAYSDIAGRQRSAVRLILRKSEKEDFYRVAEVYPQVEPRLTDVPA